MKYCMHFDWSSPIILSEQIHAWKLKKIIFCALLYMDRSFEIMWIFSRFGINYRSCSCKRKLTEWASHNLKNRYWYIKFKLACSLRTFCILLFILALCSLHKTSARLQDQGTTLCAQNFGTHKRLTRILKNVLNFFQKLWHFKIPLSPL